MDAKSRENCDGETSFLNQRGKKNNTLKTLVNGKQRLQLEKNPRNQRKVKPRMYQNKTAESAEREPVQVLYKAYKDKRPENMLKPDSPFYLAVNYFKTEGELKSEGSKWFKSQPMGVNKLNSLMKEMTETAGISVKTNHSGGETLVQKLQDNDVPPNQIVQITGHKNLQSVNNYSSLRERQMEKISKILSSSLSTTNAVPPAVV